MFTFEDILKRIEENINEREFLYKYENKVEKLRGMNFEDFEESILFKEYLGKFLLPENLNLHPWFSVPEYLKGEFNWEFLLRLVLSSFSSTYEIKFVFPNLPLICIKVSYDGGLVIKCLDGLSSFQIENMFSIYLLEQIRIMLIIREDEKEGEKIKKEREANIKHWEEEYKRVMLYFEYLKRNDNWDTNVFNNKTLE